MPPRGLPRGSMNQSNVFYTGEWTKEYDDLFILGLCEQTSVGRFCANGRANRKAVEYVMDRVNGHNGTHMSYDTFIAQFRRLYKRYTVFKYIIQHPGVVHNAITHAVTAPENIWNQICREHALAYAYMRQGEGNYDALEFIFTALPEVPDDGDEYVEIIEISSDHDTTTAEVDNSSVFLNELAWYNSQSSRDTIGQSTNLQDTGTSRVQDATAAADRSGRRRSNARNAPGSGPSSQASSSPFKPEW